MNFMNAMNAMNEMIQPPPAVQTVLEYLNRAGYPAYVVGGCVRDSLRGGQPQDWDIATAAPPERVLEIFAAFRVIETGLKHGTVTVLMDTLPIEVTTFRIDGDYSDSRRPDTVRFVDAVEEDLARRDFTVNAMAWHPREGLVDPYGGRRDLENKIIRCVGDAAARFSEDALRILRALRFAAVFGFAIEPETATELRRKAPNLDKIARERIAAELIKLLCGKNACEVMTGFPEVIATVWPAVLAAMDAGVEIYARACRVAAGVPPVPALKLAAVYLGTGGQDEREIERQLRGLKLDNATIDRTLTLARYAGAPLEKPADIRRLAGRIGEEALRQLLTLRRAACAAQMPVPQGEPEILDAAERQLNAILARNDCCALRQLAVSGADLLAAGIPAGPALGKELQRLLDAVIEGELPNERDALLAAIEPPNNNV
ncbi:MAG: tRNA nucleotidyltransferase [Oscillospiraceae bacterium]|nr:tRNA nucleotidyltransferase [Oscillospiraceae bacterium]